MLAGATPSRASFRIRFRNHQQTHKARNVRLLIYAIVENEYAGLVSGRIL
jgi:hypothetical protein